MIVGYHRPVSMDEAINLLSRSAVISKPLGGGTVLSRDKEASCEVVDLQALGLDKIIKDDADLRVGGMVTLQRLHNSNEVKSELKDIIVKEASFNVRQAATIAGALVAADRRSYLANALLALDATLVWEPGGVEISLGDWLPQRGAWRGGKIITNVMIPTRVDLSHASVSRTPMDFPIVSVAVGKWPSGRVRISIGGFGEAPVLAFDGPDASGGSAAAVNACQNAGDEWASAEYRQSVAKTLTERLIS